ncbi:MAG: hypothetical protein L3J51_09575 [Cocleimonas sp.]|nr:hypothetical protein [Cocleimonas sp.]
MKLSAGTIGTLLFTAVATAVFVWMAKRPAVDGSAMNFGMPMQSTAVVEGNEPVLNEPKIEEVEPEKMEEATSAPENSTPEPTNTDVPAEIKTEESAPEAMPTDSNESPVEPETMPATDVPTSPAS